MSYNKVGRKANAVLAAVLCVAWAAFAASQETSRINPINWSLKSDLATSVQGGTSVKAGDKLTLQLTAEIEEGWHLYSIEEVARGPKPTRITLAPNQPFELGDIEAPEPRKALDENFGIQTEFYERSVTFSLPVRVKADAPLGPYKLSVQIRYQCCNDTLCLPPKLLKVEADLIVKAGAKTTPP